MSNEAVRRVLAYDARDNVANALSPLSVGDLIEVFGQKIAARAAVPLGHKIAVRRIGQGETVVKYGEAIGRARGEIAPGEHVHVHNVESLFGDWREASAAEFER